MTSFRLVRPLALLALLAAAACGSDSTSPRASGFLGGTSADPEIAVVVNSTGKGLTLFQLGDTTQKRQLAFGTSSLITPVGLSVRNHVALVPLGDAASVALVDLDAMTVKRTFLFTGGNASGSVFVNDTTVFIGNYLGNYVGRVTLGQARDTIRDTVGVAPTPQAMAYAAGRLLVVSQNLNTAGDYSPLGRSIVTAVDPSTLRVLGTVQTSGTNANDAAIGPDGMLYVVNTGDYTSASPLDVIDPATLRIVKTYPNVGVGMGTIKIGSAGLAYISGFFTGTVVLDTRSGAFVRGPDHPLCAPLSGGGCRSAADAAPAANGDVWQVFPGDPQHNLPAYVFRYRAASGYALTDSVSAGQDPFAIYIRTF